MKINKLSNFVCVFAAFSVSTGAQQIEINKYDPENKKKTLKVKSSKRETAQRRNAITSRCSQHLLSAFKKNQLLPKFTFEIKISSFNFYLVFHFLADAISSPRPHTRTGCFVCVREYKAKSEWEHNTLASLCLQSVCVRGTLGVKHSLIVGRTTKGAGEGVKQLT